MATSQPLILNQICHWNEVFQEAIRIIKLQASKKLSLRKNYVANTQNISKVTINHLFNLKSEQFLEMSIKPDLYLSSKSELLFWCQTFTHTHTKSIKIIILNHISKKHDYLSLGFSLGTVGFSKQLKVTIIKVLTLCKVYLTTTTKYLWPMPVRNSTVHGNGISHL